MSEYFKACPTMDQLKQIFDYDHLAGRLVWINIPRHMFKTDRGWKIANTLNLGRFASYLAGKYMRVNIRGAPFAEHRLIWIWHNGKIPDGLLVDHEDQKKVNNRIENLRLASKMSNAVNSKMSIANKSGATGACWDRRRSKWRARCRINGTPYDLGLHNKLDEAISVLEIKRRKLGFSPRYGA